MCIYSEVCSLSSSTLQYPNQSTVINLGNSRIIKASPGCPPCLLGSMCCIRQAKYRFDPILRQHDSLLHFLLRSIKRWCLALYTDWLKLNSLKIKFPFKDFNDNFDSYSRLKTRATVFPAVVSLEGMFGTFKQKWHLLWFSVTVLFYLVFRITTFTGTLPDST